MPMDKSKYPDNWREISKAARIKACNSCEFCGAKNYQPHPATCSKVILTVAHLNHIPMDCRPENLKALCQKCHLNYDKEHHAETRRNNKLRNQMLVV